MAILDFPQDTSQSPYVANGVTYEWDGEKWTAVFEGGGGGASVHVGTNPPTGTPSEGDLWWQDEEARLYVYYTDADSSQWVDASPGGASTDGGGGGTVGNLQQVTNQGNTTTNALLVVNDTAVTSTTVFPEGQVWTSHTLLDTDLIFASGKAGEDQNFAVYGDGGIGIGPDVTTESTNTITLGADGSASFAKYVISGEDSSNGANVGSALVETGQIQGTGATGSSPIFRAYTLGSSTPTADINADGSASFARTVTAGFTANTGNGLSTNNDSASNSTILAQNKNAAGLVFDGRDNTDGLGVQTSSIGAAGNATFASYVQVDRTLDSPNFNNSFYEGVLNGDTTLKLNVLGQGIFGLNPANSSTNESGVFIAGDIGRQTLYKRSDNTNPFLTCIKNNGAGSGVTIAEITSEGYFQATQFKADGNSTGAIVFSGETNGTATFSVGGDGTTWIGGTIPSSPAIKLSPDGNIQSIGPLTVSRDDAADGILVGKQGTTPKSTLFADGTLKLGGTSTAAPNIDIRPDTNGGLINVGAPGTSDRIVLSASGGFAIYEDGDSTVKATIFNDGSAAFSGDVTVGGPRGTENAAYITFTGDIVSDRTDPESNCFYALNKGDTKALIKSGGSALFADGDIRLNVVPTGANIIIRDDNDTVSPLLDLYKNGFTPGTDRVAAIFNDGSASFTSIKFPTGSNTADKTVTSNTLDDYEEGTFTPVADSGFTTDPFTLSGWYTKIGRVVTVQIAMTGGVWGDGALITGLPFMPIAGQANTPLSGVSRDTRDPLVDSTFYSQLGMCYRSTQISLGVISFTPPAGVSDYGSYAHYFQFSYYA